MSGRYALERAELAKLPSAEDIRAYQTRGFHLVRGVFTDTEIEDAAFGVARYYAGERDFGLSELLRPFEGARGEDTAPRRLNDYTSLQIQEISQLVCKPLLAAIAARLVETDEIRLWHDQLIRKAPGQADTGIGWHTDRDYWTTCSSDQMVTAFIPLQDTDQSMGTLVFVAGSHLRLRTETLRGFHQTSLTSFDGKTVSFDLKRGDVTYHHCRTIHGSRPNHSERVRLSLSVHMQDRDNGRRVAPTGAVAAETFHYNDALCRKANGVADYRDPDICPVLWREAAQNFATKRGST